MRRAHTHCIESYEIIMRSVCRHQLIECENDWIINSTAFGDAAGEGKGERIEYNSVGL